MAKHYRKGDNQGVTLKIILFVTALINLANALIEFIKRLTG